MSSPTADICSPPGGAVALLAAQLRAVWQNVPDGMLLGRPDGTVLLANPAALALLGMTEDQIIERGRDGLLDYSDPVWPVGHQQYETTGCMRGQLRVLHAGGERIPVDLSAADFTGPDGLAYTTVQLRDLRPDERALRDKLLSEQALYERERILRAFFESTAQGVVIQDTRGHVLDVNPAGLEILGITEPIDLTRRLAAWPVIRADGSPCAASEWPAARAIASGRSVADEVLGVWNERQADWRWVVVHARPVLRPDDGTVAQVCIGFSDITELRAATARAVSAAERTRRILETVTDAITIVDAEGVITYANAAAEQVLGLEADSMQGRTYADVRWRITALDGGPFPVEQLPFERVRRTGAPVSDVRHAIVHADGRRIVVSVNAAPLHEADGAFAGMIAAVRDVTLAQQEQDRLLHLAALVASSPDAMIGMDRDGRVTSWNETAVALFGYTAPEILGEPIETLIPDRLQPEVEEVRAALRAGRTRLSLETVRRRKDGSTFPVSLSIAPMRAPDGTVAGAAAVVRDTSERVAAEAQLRFQARLLDSVQEAVAAISAEGRYSYVNDRARELFGWDPERILGRHYSEVVARGFPPEVEARIQRCLQGEPWVSELAVRDIDGRELPALLTLAPTHDDAGAVNGVVGLLSDLRRVRSLEEQLGHAQKMEAVGRLAGGVAHDFNNVLTAIQGHAQLALDDVPPDGRVHADLLEILRSTERATTLTRHLLAFSRRQVLQPRVVEVAQVIHGIEAMLRRLIGEDIELLIDCPATVGCALVDPVQLEQVILNLVVNARDAMPAGGRITMRARAGCPRDSQHTTSDAERPQVVITVADTGTGIPRDVQQRIFEPFFTTKPAGKGSGLGLSTAYGIVTQSGGFIMVDSTEGRGSSFSVHLPLVQPASPEAAAAPAASATGGTETVLLVEDEESVRRLAHRILAMRGYQVIEAEDGAAALELAAARDGGIDVLVTDIVMPRTNGLELVRTLRQQRPTLPVLLMSGYSEEMVEQRGAIPEHCIFLGKPFSPQALAAAVRDAVAAAPRT